MVEKGHHCDRLTELTGDESGLAGAGVALGASPLQFATGHVWGCSFPDGVVVWGCLFPGGVGVWGCPFPGGVVVWGCPFRGGVGVFICPALWAAGVCSYLLCICGMLFIYAP